MPLESALRQARFTSRDRQRFDRHCKILKADRHIVPRFAYNRGCVRVLTDSSDYPWWTVQQVTGNTVHWFVDFPTETPIDALVAFADSVDG